MKQSVRKIKKNYTYSIGTDTDSITSSIDDTTSSMGNTIVSMTRIYVETGMESDYYIEIISDELYEGMQIVATESSGDNTSGSFGDMGNIEIMPGESMGGEPGGGMGGNPGGGGMPGNGF